MKWNRLTNLPDKKFKALVIKMLTRFERKTDELRENFKKEKVKKKKPFRVEYNKLN